MPWARSWLGEVLLRIEELSQPARQCKVPEARAEVAEVLYRHSEYLEEQCARVAKMG